MRLAMEVYRTPDNRFAALPDYTFEPHYVDWEGLRVHHVDEGPRDATAWHHRLPGSTLDRIEGAGHFVQEDAAADCVAMLLGHAGMA